MRLFQKLINTLFTIDIWWNARILNGHHGESISSRCGKAQFRSVLKIIDHKDVLWLNVGRVVDFIFFWDRGWHCVKYIQWDVGKPTLPTR